MRIAYVCGHRGYGKSTLAEQLKDSTGFAITPLDQAIKDTLLRACPFFHGTDFWAVESPSRETWTNLFKHSDMTSAFGCTFRSMLHIDETESFPERLIIEGSQLVWQFWQGPCPLRAVFDTLFGRDCEWGLYLIKRTPQQVVEQIKYRNRSNEKKFDLKWAEKAVPDYAEKFEELRSSWEPLDSGHDDPELLSKRITTFLSTPGDS